MAQSLEQILGKTINSTKELRDEIKRLQDQLVNVEQGTDTWEETTKKLVAAQEKLTSVTKAGKQSIDAAEDSIVGMEKQYKALYNTYKLLTEEQRNSDFGKQMATSLNELSAKLNTTKKDVGNFKDNIGRYAESASEAFAQMGISIGGLQGPLGLVNGSFGVLNKTMLANPVFWIIAAIKVLIGVFNRVKEAINGNEESQMRLNEAMAAFQPVIDATANLFDKLAQKVVDAIEWISKAYTKVREISAAVTDFLGITDGANEKIKEQDKLYRELAKRQNELTKAKREQEKLNAKDTERVKTLLNEAAATSDIEERTRLLNEAKQTQEQITQRNLQVAQEEFDILRTKSTLTANDAEMNDKLAAAEANLNRVVAEGAEKTKEMNSQITSLTNSKKGATDATNDYIEALKKEKEEAENVYQDTLKNSKSELQKLEENYKKKKALLEKYGKDTTLLDIEYETMRRGVLAEEWNATFEAQNDWNQRMNETFYKGTKTYYENNVRNLEALKETYEGALNEYKNNFANKFKEVEKDILKGDYSDEERKFIMGQWTINFWSSLGKMFGEPIQSELMADQFFAIIKENIEQAKKAVTDFVETSADQASQKRFQTEALDLDFNYIKNTAEYNANTNSDAERMAYAKELQEKWYNDYKALLEKEIADQTISKDRRIELEREYYSLKEEMRIYDEEQERLKNERVVGYIESSVSSLLTSISYGEDAVATYGDLIKKELEEGKLTEKEAEKKKKQYKNLQKAQMAMAIAGIVGDAATGIMGIWAGLGQSKKNNAATAAMAGTAAAVVEKALNVATIIGNSLQTAGILASASAQIAAVKGNYLTNVSGISEMSGGGAVAAVAPESIDTTAYTYTRQLQTEQEEEEMNRPIWVSVEDIASGLNKAEVREEDATF